MQAARPDESDAEKMSRWILDRVGTRFGVGPVIVHGLALTALAWQSFGLISGSVWFATLALGCAVAIAVGVVLTAIDIQSGRFLDQEGHGWSFGLLFGPDIFGGITTLHFGRDKQPYLLLPLIPDKAAR